MDLCLSTFWPRLRTRCWKPSASSHIHLNKVVLRAGYNILSSWQHLGITLKNNRVSVLAGFDGFLDIWRTLYLLPNHGSSFLPPCKRIYSVNETVSAPAAEYRTSTPERLWTEQYTETTRLRRVEECVWNVQEQIRELQSTLQMSLEQGKGSPCMYQGLSYSQATGAGHQKSVPHSGSQQHSIQHRSTSLPLLYADTIPGYQSSETNEVAKYASQIIPAHSSTTALTQPYSQLPVQMPPGLLPQAQQRLSRPASVPVTKHHVEQGCQTQGPRAYFSPPHHFMWPARAYDCLTKKNKKKNSATLYHTLWKCVSIPQVSVSICRSVYTQKLTLVCVWYAMVFPLMMTAWTAQRNKADLIKCSSTIDGKTRCSPFI